MRALPRRRSPSRRSIASGNNPPPLKLRLERDIVVGELGAGLDHVFFRWACAARLLASAAAPHPSSEQDDAIAADLGGVPFVAVLVVPLAGLQPALDVDLFAFRQVLVQ